MTINTIHLNTCQIYFNMWSPMIVQTNSLSEYNVGDVPGCDCYAGSQPWSGGTRPALLVTGGWCDEGGMRGGDNLPALDHWKGSI